MSVAVEVWTRTELVEREEIVADMNQVHVVEWMPAWFRLLVPDAIDLVRKSTKGTMRR